MKKKIIILILLISSFAFAKVDFKIESSQNPIIHKIGTATVKYQKIDIIITRTSANEEINITTNKLLLFDVDGSDWYKVAANLNTINGYLLSFKDLTMGGSPWSSSTTFTQGWSTGNRMVQGKIQVQIPWGTSDFNKKPFGSYLLGGTYGLAGGTRGSVFIGTITLQTRNLLEVTVPKIDFGDVLTDTNRVSKSGNIIVKGQEGMAVTMKILGKNIELTKTGTTDKINGTIRLESADSNGVVKHIIPNQKEFLQKVEVELFNFKNNNPGHYYGNVQIDISVN